MGMLVDHRQIPGFWCKQGNLGNGHTGFHRSGGLCQGIVFRRRAGKGHLGQGNSGIIAHVGTADSTGQAGDIDGHLVSPHLAVQDYSGYLYLIVSVIAFACGGYASNSKGLFTDGELYSFLHTFIIDSILRSKHNCIFRCIAVRHAGLYCGFLPGKGSRNSGGIRLAVLRCTRKFRTDKGIPIND